jgi:RNA polymerase sigma factor (sigma-70 family)
MDIIRTKFKIPNNEAPVPSQSPPAERTAASEPVEATGFPLRDWAAVVDRIRSGDGGALEELYAIFARGIRYFLMRNLGSEDLDDRVHDCFVVVAEAIRRGDLRDPARLMGYVRTVVKRHVASAIETAVDRRRTRAEYDESLFSLGDWQENPEQSIMSQERTEIARKVLRAISRRDREILSRFYVEEQSQTQICEEMGLSPTQFRLLKSRAKKRFGLLGQRVAKGMGRTLPGQ